jgi:hypothetical protein
VNTIQGNIKHPIKMTPHSATLKISNSSRNGKHNVSAVQNQLSGVNITSVTNNTSLPRNIEIITASNNQNPWLLLPQFVVSGAVAGLALVLANRFLDHYRKPCLFIDSDLKLVHVELTLFRIDIPGFYRELSEFKEGYTVNRVTIRNSGRSAAENCKGILKIGGKEEKICWQVPTERYTMTINVDSIEYLDVCAVLERNPEEVFADLKMFVSKFGDEKDRGSPEARAYVNNIYRTSKDIPVIIAPTEEGWQPAHLNRKINPCNATIIVTAKNVTQSLKQNIRILDRRDENRKIIELLSASKPLHYCFLDAFRKGPNASRLNYLK